MTMRVLGLDPGTATFGWGVVEVGGLRPLYVAHGALRTAASASLGTRLGEIRDEIAALISQHRPDRIAIERIFTQANVQSAVAIGASRGIALLVAADHGVEVVEATPSEMKRVVAGDGRATKGMVTKAITKLLALPVAPTPDDAADALALALWGAGARRGEQRVGSSRLDRSAAAPRATERGFDRAVRAALRANRT
ncbi:MAG: crossover junction endodeoxyribonuclease RuvC [bacterium]|nr:crossover junction endodeoxyribonuclease RuvC [Candidatus Aquidulcis sp.]